MESKMYLVCLNILIFLCVIQSSAALKCFTCDSASNKHCSDLSDKALQPQECISEGLLSQGASVFSQLGGNSNKDPLTPVCMKMVTRNSTHGTLTARRCAVKTQSQDACSLVRSTFQQTGVNNQLEFCGSCENKDGCNSAHTIQLISTLVAFGAMLSVARLVA